MHLITKILTVFAISITLVACKEETKDTSAETVKENIQKKIEAQTPEVKQQINSVMTKSMVTPELKTFTSALVTAGLVDLLTKEEGPFTLLAPSNDAFEKLDNAKLNTLMDPKNKGRLTLLLKNHIAKGNIDSAALVQNIKNGTGEYTIEMLSGTKLMASLNGTDIVIKDSRGTEATVGKSDIKGSNGMVHVVNGILGSY